MKRNNEAMAYIDELAGRRVKNGLGNIRRLLPPEREGSVIHVTGTNGKGSICAFLSSIYRSAGYRVGVFTSPHLVDVRERIRINEECIAWERFDELVLRLREQAITLEERYQTRFGFFEFLLAVAMTYFEEEGVDLILSEVGIGGLYDATNYIRRPAAAVIASISLDHEAILGQSLEAVAVQKAGIIKEGAPLIYLKSGSAADGVIEETAAQKKVSAYPVGSQDYQVIGAENGGLRCQIFGQSCVLPTRAFYQAENAALAYRVVQVLLERYPVEQTALIDGLERFSWPGRLERVADGIYLDGGHNPAGIRAMLASVKAMCGEKKLLFGVVKDKKYDTMIQELAAADVFDDIYVVGLQTARQTQASELAAVFDRVCRCPVTVCASVSEALRLLLANHRFADDEKLLVCAGSLYLVGEIKEYLHDQF